ncbi:MAG: hypothetical protein RL758_1800 [Pseudomonadota bacterium]|jgi:hypothetical protein
MKPAQQRLTRGGFPFMAPHQAHTLETIHARCVEEGDCWIWLSTKCKQAPVLRHERKVWPVRRYVAEVLQGKRARGLFAHTCCGNLDCVAPDHIRLFTRRQLQLVTAERTQYGKSPVRSAKLRRAAQARQGRTPEQVEAIRQAEGSMRQVARDFGVCFDVVRRIRHGDTYRQANNPWSGLASQGTAKRFWTEHEITVLREQYPHRRAEEVAALLDRSARQVYQKAYHLGLRKTEAFFEGNDSGRVQPGKQAPSMRAGHFKPGMVPWNAGKKGWDAGGNSHSTRFKKGEMHGAAQHNYVPIGTLRVSREGYLERKVNDTHPVPARRWVSVHRLVWEAVNGPVPAGHLVTFLPGAFTNEESQITLDKLQLLTRAENMRRNSVHTKYPTEVVRLVQLKGAITRQVNRIQKESAA